MPHPTSVLFVCLGNICRSPMADAIARHRYPHLRVDSAGTAAYHEGEAADPRTLEVLRRHHIPYDGRARKVRASDFEDFDLVLAMDRSNLVNLRRVCPEALLHKVHLVLEPLEEGREVGDPYYGGKDGFDKAFRELSRGHRTLAILRPLEGESMPVSRLLALVFLGVVACKDDPAPPSTTDEDPEPEPLWVDVAPPRLPSQLLIDLDPDAPELAELEVLHEGPSGSTSTLEAVYTDGGDRIGWRAPGGRWATGSHTVSLDPEVALWGSPDGGVEAFTFDIAETWDGDGRDHEAWTIDLLVLPPSGLGPLVLDQIGELVVVPPVEEGGDWVLLTTLSDCVIYRGPVVVLPDGYELTLATMEVDIGAEGPLVLEETELAFSFASDGSEGVGQFRTVADGRQTTDLDEDGGIGPAFVCDVAPSFGAACHRCEPDDAEALCFDAFAPWIGLSPRAEPLPFDPLSLPICGVDVSGAEAPELEITIAPIDCSFEPLELDPDLDCGCRSVPGRGLAFAPVVVLWWRRRRSGT